MAEGIVTSIRVDIERLCAPGDRDPGTERNRAATAYVLERLRGLGLETHTLEFDVPEWRYTTAVCGFGGRTLTMHPGPFSPACDGSGILRVVRHPRELADVEAGSVLLLADEIAATQFTPREYPFYSDPDHAAILDALEAARPLAVLAATTSSAMTGAMSPFPLIEEVRFTAPSAYLTAEEGRLLAAHEGEAVSVRIESEVLASTGQQPVGRRAGASGARIIVSAHVDSKPETPGAIDNAAGVAVLLAVAEQLGDRALSHTVEFVPFNGEDHVLAPGELAWLAANPDLDDIRLVINIDAPGLPGSPTAYSVYGLDEATTACVEAVAAGNPGVAPGPQWPASDHMVFAMRGIPAIALTSTDFVTASRSFSHTPADTQEILDHELLEQAARFVAELVAGL